MQKSENLFKKVVIHPKFSSTLNDLKKLNMSLVKEENVKKESDFILNTTYKLSEIEEDNTKNLDSKNGCEFVKDKQILAYDESVNKFSGLEGESYFASHSLVLLGETDYLPINFLSLYFYTKAKDILKESNSIKYTENSEVQSKIDFMKDKIEFLLNNCPENSILLIDGPLIAGDAYTYMISALEKFESKNIIPIFFVKNSLSNMVIEGNTKLSTIYNNDLHWAYKTLKQGQRSKFFKYVDQANNKNSKIFCYLKSFDCSPQRLEIPVNIFIKHKFIINDLIDMVYYLILSQGDIKNPQVRPIAIAEMYARNTLKLINFKDIIKSKGITPTMNEERFAW